MLNHSTTSINDQYEVTALVLVGPPAAGKTTIREICADYGVHGCDVGMTHSGGSVDPNAESIIEETIAGTSSPPGVCCIEGPISDDEVSTVREYAEATLVVRVSAPDQFERLNRYVDREVEGHPIAEQGVQDARDEARDREEAERPYPTHDVQIVNDKQTSITELTNRCVNLIAGLSSEGREYFESPADVNV